MDGNAATDTHLKTTPRLSPEGLFYKLDLRTGVIQHVLSNRTRLPKYTQQMCHYTTLHVSKCVTQSQTHTQLTVSTTVLLNHKATATKDPYHVTLYKQQHAAKRFTKLNLRGEIESV